PDIDVYELTLTAGDLFVADIDAESLAIPSSLDSYLKLYDSSGNSVAANSNGINDNVDALLRYQIPADGTYYVVVSNSSSAFNQDPQNGTSSSNGTTGNYELTFSRYATNQTSINPLNVTASTGTPASADFASVHASDQITITGQGFNPLTA